MAAIIDEPPRELARGKMQTLCTTPRTLTMTADDRKNPQSRSAPETPQRLFPLLTETTSSHPNAAVKPSDWQNEHGRLDATTAMTPRP